MQQHHRFPRPKGLGSLLLAKDLYRLGIKNRGFFARNKRGTVVILLLLLAAVSMALLFVLLFRSGTFDSLLSKSKSTMPFVSKGANDEELTKGDDIEDIEKDLNSTNLSETDKVLGEVDVTLENQ